MGHTEKYKVGGSKGEDFQAWIALAREVEPLFGPMADEPGFRDALQQAIDDKTAFCIRACPDHGKAVLVGGIVISKPANAIAWLAVSGKYRKMGYGRDLLAYALTQLNSEEDIIVQTFDEFIPEGKAARKLYLEFGFVDDQDGGLNPAGVSTVIMRRVHLAGSAEQQYDAGEKEK